MKIKPVILSAFIFALVLLCGCNTSANENIGGDENINSDVSSAPTQEQTNPTRIPTDVPTIQYIEMTQPESQTMTEYEQSQQQEKTAAVSGRYTVDYVTEISTQAAVEPSVVFGSAYRKTSKSLTLKDDNTFSLDVSVSKSNDDVTGKYILSDDKTALSAAFNNGTQKVFEIEYSDDTITHIIVPYGGYLIYFH